MSNFGILCKTEFKKILCKKAIWITLVLGLAFILVADMSDILFNESYYYGDLKVPIAQIERMGIENSKEVNGKPMDEAFYERFRLQMSDELEAQKDNPAVLNDPSSLDAGYPGFWPVAELTGNSWFVQNEIRRIGASNDERYNLLMKGSVEEIEAAKRNKLEINVTYDCPKEDEADYWMSRYDSIPKPYIYSYGHGYYKYFSSSFVTIWLSFLIILIGLAGSFADENTFRTDALILSSRYGRKRICRAKLLVGLCFSVISTMVIMIICFVIPMLVYGAEGWNTPVQNALIGCAFNMTIGQAVILTFVFGILVSLLWGSTVMLLSFGFKNIVPVMAIHAAALMLSVFNLPDSMGIISQIWALKPAYFVYQGMFMEYRLFNIAGLLINNLQMAAVVFILVTVISVVATARFYRNVQVASR
ncbi:MAG: hypothetical protein J5537_03565 [Lachnospiraceae bacterium]|nr:hypothetical protein [Lachnospiraceae bacterium]